jgi:hypothetical protein
VRGHERSRRDFIDGLMAVGRFYEEKPEAYYDRMKVTLCMYVEGRNARRALAGTARAFGECEKSFDEKHIGISKQFSENVRVELFAPGSDVCRQIILGTRIEPPISLPATGAIYIPEFAVEVLGWNCDPALVR